MRFNLSLSALLCVASLLLSPVFAQEFNEDGLSIEPLAAQRVLVDQPLSVRCSTGYRWNRTQSVFHQSSRKRQPG